MSTTTLSDLGGIWIPTPASADVNHRYTEITAKTGTYQRVDFDAKSGGSVTSGTVSFVPSSGSGNLGSLTFTPASGAPETYTVGETKAGVVLRQGSRIAHHRVHCLACYLVKNESGSWVKTLDEGHERGFLLEPGVSSIEVDSGQTVLLRYDLATDVDGRFATGDDWIAWGSKKPDGVSGIRLSDRVVLIFDQDTNTSEASVRYTFNLKLATGEDIDPVIVHKGTPPPP